MKTQIISKQYDKYSNFIGKTVTEVVSDDTKMDAHTDFDEVVGVCNRCGKGLDFWDRQENFSIAKCVWYGSTHDGEFIHIRLCCNCFDNLVAECMVSPVIT